MRKLGFNCGIGVAVVLATAALVATVAGPPEAVTIDDCANKQPAVNFPHAAHVELTECTTCHHTQEGLTAESADEVQPCSSCHTEPAEAGTPKCSEMSMTKNPFHITCVGCHKETKKADAETKAPTTCKGCHVKA